MLKNCGLIREANPCKCEEQAERDINIGLINPQQLDFAPEAKQQKDRCDISNALKELKEMDKIITLFRTYPRYKKPTSFPEIMKRLIQSQQFSLLQS